MDKNSKASKSETAYVEIRRIIAEFALIPGQIICINQLSDFLKISTTPLREALIGLEKDGYVARNRKESFCVAQIDGNYVRDLFEYGRILYVNATGNYCQYKNDIQGNHARLLCNKQASTFDIDSLYQDAQNNTKNEFLRRQIEIFRFKSNAIRIALSHLNDELYLSIYKDLHSHSIIEFDLNRLFEETHSRKREFAEKIAQSVLSYSIIKTTSSDTKYNIDIINKIS